MLPSHESASDQALGRGERYPVPSESATLNPGIVLDVGSVLVPKPTPATNKYINNVAT